MRIELPVSEAVAFARTRDVLPSMIESLTSEGSAIEIVIDLRLIPAENFAMKLFAAAAGTVTVTATFVGFTDGIATFDMGAEARGINADTLLSAMIGRANASIRDSDLPEGVVEFADSAVGTQLLINLQAILDDRMHGVTVSDVRLRNGVLSVEAGL
ncbi:MAG: hypothetical protein ACOH1J_05010 [Microbacteriaceae bacterium]